MYGQINYYYMLLPRERYTFIVQIFLIQSNNTISLINQAEMIMVRIRSSITSAGCRKVGGLTSLIDVAEAVMSAIKMLM